MLDNPANKALLLCQHGIAWVLTYEVDDAIDEYMKQCGASSDGFAVEDWIDWSYPGDGLFVVDVSLEDDGPSDWSDSERECITTFKNPRAATKEEFESFRRAEYVWFSEGPQTGLREDGINVACDTCLSPMKSTDTKCGFCNLK